LKTEEEARLKAEEEARLKTEEEARLKAEEEARLKAEEEARLKAEEEEARLKAEEEARLKAEEEARLKAEEEEARLKAEEEAKLKAEEEARLKTEEEARLKAEEEARLKTEEAARLKAEEEARLKAEEEARLKAEGARLKAEEEARLKAEEEARLKAEEEARLKAEEEAQLKAQEEARLRAEERARLQAEEEARLSVDANARLKAEEEEEEEDFAVPTTPHDVLALALSLAYPGPSRPQFFDTEKSLPISMRAVAIFTTLLDIKFFTDLSAEDYSRCFSLLESQYASVFLATGTSSRIRFICLVTFANLVSTNQSSLHFNPGRVSQVLALTHPFIVETTRAILHVHLSALNVISNRFISARFDANSLLEDTAEVMTRVKRALQFGMVLNQLLTAQLLTEFQISTANKMLANPARFNFANAVRWTSFLSAADMDHRINLPILREVALALNMAKAICDKPKFAREICPTLPVDIIAFLLMMFAPDNTITTPINAVRFMESYHIRGLSPEVAMPAADPAAFVPVEAIPWKRWIGTRFDEETLITLPFLANYLSE
jgi:hypothetical protein